MHSIKGSWVGQTFAIANRNDSGGKKSRIRRSKEERKSLVESFIKQHQKLNNGSFPSLNLTHKEVGGSFYTVREIVREVIQENKVLGPGNPNDILQQHLLGSLCNENESDLFSTNGCSPLVTHILPHDQDTNEELFPSDNVEGLETESPNYFLGDKLYFDGSSENFQKTEEHEREMAVVSEGRENLVLEEGLEDIEVCSAKVPSLEAASTGEKSPLRSGHELADNLYVLNENYGDKEAQNTDVGGINFLENVSCFADENLVGKVEVNVEEYLANSIAKEDTNSEEPDLNANTKSMDLESQSLGEKLLISEFENVSENNERQEDAFVTVGSGDREILKIEEVSHNGNALNEILGKGRIPELEEKTSNLNKHLVNEDNSEPEEKSSIGSIVRNKILEKGEISELIEKSNNGSVLIKNSEKDGISEPEEKPSSTTVLNEIFEKEKIPELEEKTSSGSVLIENVAKAEILDSEGKSNNGSVSKENSEKGEISELEVKSSNGIVLNQNLEKAEIPELKEKSSNGSVLDEKFEKGQNPELEEKNSTESFVIDETNFQESVSDFNDARKIANNAVKQLENCRHLVIEKPPLEEISKYSMVKEGTVLDTEDKDSSVVRVKMAVSTNGINSQNFRNAKTSSSEQTFPKMAKATQSNPNIQLADDLKEAKSTLDRINLESWKKTSDQHQEMPTNPLLAYFKAFITAFVKFWSE